MISKRVVLVGTAVVGVSYVLAIEGVFSKPRPQHAAASAPETPALPVPARPQADALTTRELAQLSKGVAQLHNELASLRERPATAPHADRPAEPPQKSDEQVQLEHDQYMAEIEHAFEREPRDDAWAKNTTEALRQTVEAEPLMLAALRGIECRSTSCRMEVYDDGSAAFTESFPGLLHQMGAILPEVRYDHAELSGSSQLHTLYMSKSTAE